MLDMLRYEQLVETSTVIPWRRITRAFRRCEMPKVEPTPNHAHGLEAGHRSAAQHMIMQFVRSCGLNPYCISSRSRERGSLGYSGVHSPFDAAHELKCDPLPDDPCFVMIDVDYYVDINQLMSYGLPIVLYTFSPRVPAGALNATEWWCENGQLVTQVSGGSTYRHGLWDYSKDELVIPYEGGHYVYRVDRKPVGIERAVVLLTPVSRIEDSPKWSTPLFNEILLCRLSLQSPVRWQYSSIDIFAFSGDRRSYAVDIDTIETLKRRAALGLRISEVQAFLKEVSVPEDIGDLVVTDPYSVAPRAHALLGLPELPPRTNLVAIQLAPVPQAAAKPLTRDIPDVEPLAAGAVHHTKGVNAECASIQGRLTDVRNDATKISPEVSGYINEFVALTMAGAALRPLDQQEVEDHQNRPTQRAGLERVRNTYGVKPPVVQSFIKAEAYPKASVERNISTLPPDHRTEFSRFTLALSKHLASATDWYSFSRPPADLANLINQKVSNWESCAENDYSKFDGTNGIVQSVVLARVLLSAFPQHQEAVMALTEAEVDAPAFTSSGLAYSPGFSTLSGSACTSVRNSLNNAFVAYYAWRLKGEPPEASYAQLGVYGGDDGLDNGGLATHLVEAARTLGLTSKTKTIPKNAPVSFLGRIYPNAWAGPESFSDPVRHLVKLHVTSENDPNVAPEDIVLRKAEGFIATDRKTPVLTDWAKFMICNKTPKGTKPREKNWWAQVVAEDGPFPQLPYDEALPHVASALGLTSAQLMDEIRHLRKTGKFTKIMDFTQPPSVIGKVLLVNPGGDQLVEGKPLTRPPPPRKTDRKERRKAFVKEAKATDVKTSPTTRPTSAPKPAPAKVSAKTEGTQPGKPTKTKPVKRVPKQKKAEKQPGPGSARVALIKRSSPIPNDKVEQEESGSPPSGPPKLR